MNNSPRAEVFKLALKVAWVVSAVLVFVAHVRVAWFCALYAFMKLSSVHWDVEPVAPPSPRFAAVPAEERWVVARALHMRVLREAGLVGIEREDDDEWGPVEGGLPGAAAAAAPREPHRERARRRATDVCLNYVRDVDTSDLGAFEFIAYRVIRSYICGEPQADPGFFKEETWEAIERLRRERMEEPDFDTVEEYREKAGNNPVRQLVLPEIRGESDLVFGIHEAIKIHEERLNEQVRVCRPYMKGIEDSSPDSREYVMYRLIRDYVCGGQAQADNPKILGELSWQEILQLREAHCVVPGYRNQAEYQRSVEPNNPTKLLASRYRDSRGLQLCINEVIKPPEQEAS